MHYVLLENSLLKLICFKYSEFVKQNILKGIINILEREQLWLKNVFKSKLLLAFLKIFSLKTN